MRVTTHHSTAPGQWSHGAPLDRPADLVLIFASPDRIGDPALRETLRALHPTAAVAGCSTAGEIHGIEATEGAATATAIAFDHTRVVAETFDARLHPSHRALGGAIAARLAGPELSHVFLLSDGLRVDGSELVKGLLAALPPGVGVTGGLAGDGNDFARTQVLDETGADASRVRAVALYGDRIAVRAGSEGGWRAFGPRRLITRAEGSVLYELDHRPALEVYRRYLGDQADLLPAAGLRYPLEVSEPDGSPPIVRTLLSVDAEAGALIFAGAVGHGSHARLMQANVDGLIGGAAAAATACVDESAGPPPTGDRLALLVSCIGRQLVLRQRTEEELEAVEDILGDATLTGFYSYGEIGPHSTRAPSVLHNQTMSITLLQEL